MDETNPIFYLKAVVLVALLMLGLALLFSSILYSSQKQLEIPKNQIVGTVSDAVYKCGDSSYSFPTTPYVKQPFNGAQFIQCLKESGYSIKRIQDETK